MRLTANFINQFIGVHNGILTELVRLNSHYPGVGNFDLELNLLDSVVPGHRIGGLNWPVQMLIIEDDFRRINGGVGPDCYNSYSVARAACWGAMVSAGADRLPDEMVAYLAASRDCFTWLQTRG